MSNKRIMKAYYKDQIKYGDHPIYSEHSRSVKYPFASTRQNSKKYKETTARNGFTTIGRA